MEELLRYEKQLEIMREKETERLLSLGYTKQELKALIEALEYISYPIVAAYYDNPQKFMEELSEEI